MGGQVFCNRFNGTNDVFHWDTTRDKGKIKTFLEYVEGRRVKFNEE
jgi:hypothetical protein